MRGVDLVVSVSPDQEKILDLRVSDEMHEEAERRLI
jgi:hypothetical protein